MRPHHPAIPMAPSSSHARSRSARRIAVVISGISRDVAHRLCVSCGMEMADKLKRKAKAAKEKKRRARAAKAKAAETKAAKEKVDPQV